MLAGLALLGVVALAVSVGRTSVAMAQQNRALHGQIIENTAFTRELLQIDWVRQHLQKHGVGPYLPTVAERVAEDVEHLMKTLNMTEAQAVEYLKGGAVGG